jgi:mRNA-degrading endonuclease RelE of RelBE toxin-antitoxin system
MFVTNNIQSLFIQFFRGKLLSYRIIFQIEQINTFCIYTQIMSNEGLRN